MKQPTKKLIEAWDRKLAKAGFDDAEDRKTGLLHRWDDSYYRRRYTPEAFAAKQRYYELCQERLLKGDFASPLHQQVWQLHCEGLSHREIAKKLKTNKDRSHEIVLQILQEAGIRDDAVTRRDRKR